MAQKIKNQFIMTIIGKTLQILNPHYSYCERCGYTWNFCKSKSVYTSERTGTFATCQKCWDKSSLKQLVRYYTIVYKKQERSLLFTEFSMDYPLEHLIRCVEAEYYKTRNNSTWK